MTPEESKQIKESIEKIGSSVEGERKAHEEMLKRIEKNESGQAEMLEQVKKWEAETNAHQETKTHLEQLASQVERMNAEFEEKAEKAGPSSETKAAVSSALRKLVQGKSVMNLHGANLDEAEIKAMSASIDPNGGYLVDSFMDPSAKTRLFDTSPLRSLASVVSIGTGMYEAIIDDDEVSSAWVGETDSRASTATATIGKVQIPVHEQYANIPLTQTLIDDASVNMMSWAGSKAMDKFARTEATAFVTGDGSNKPEGFTTATAKTTNADAYTRGRVGTKVAAATGAITTDELVELRALLKSGYRANAYFAYNRATEGVIRKLKDGQNNYIWQPNYQAGEPDQLLGQRTVVMEDMPDLAANAISVALADFRTCYQIVDRSGMTLLDDPYTNKPYRQLYYCKRVGGGLVQWDAIKYLKQAAS